VAGGEKIKIDDASLGLIAAAADGSFRDGIKILEQLVAEEKNLDKDTIGEFLFKNKSFDLDKFTSLVISKNIKGLLMELENLESKGAGVDIFLESLIKKFRISLLSKVGVGEDTLKDLSKDELIKLIDLLDKAYGEIGSSSIEELPLELALISWCGDAGDASTSGRLENNSPSAEGRINPASSPSQDLVQTEFSGSAELPNNLGVDDSAWKQILELIKPINASMEALLRAAKPMTYNGKVLTLGVYYKFHKERLEEAKHRKILEEVVGKVLQSTTRVSCVLVDPPPKKIIEESKIETVLTEGTDKDIMKAAEEIFSN